MQENAESADACSEHENHHNQQRVRGHSYKKELQGTKNGLAACLPSPYSSPRFRTVIQVDSSASLRALSVTSEHKSL
jgi:hypothetical protein